MVYSSLSFLCLFMPVVVILYHRIPPFLRNGFLLAASLLFYAWGEPKYILIMLFSTVFDYTNGRLLEKLEGAPRKRKWIVGLSVVGNLAILGYFKYFSFLLTNLNAVCGTSFYGMELALPIGISFYTFQTMSYTIDVYRGNARAQRSLLSFAMYVCLFPQLIAGPIVRYVEIADEIPSRTVTSEDCRQGLCRFCIGLGKKVLCANQIGALWEEIAGISNRSAGLAWLGALAFTMQIYYDFSGYSDMAIGLGRMFGFHFPENFDKPYLADSITDFWRRWHKTMGRWFQEYVYIPLGGNRCSRGKQIRNLFLVWSLTGLWHGAGWNFILWGWFYFLLLVGEKFLYRKWLDRLPNAVRHGYVMFFVILGWMLFANENLMDVLSYFRQMISFGHLWDRTTLFYWSNYGILLVGLVLGCTRLPQKVGEIVQKLLRKEKHEMKIHMIYAIFVLLLSIVFLVGDGYNPFLYFRF